MQKMQEIENEFLRVCVDESGGALNRVFDKRRNKELLWQGSENSWKGRDVVIFPFVARLKDRTYTVDGKEYSMDNHGLVRYSVLNVSKRCETSVELELESDENTLKRYPFPFRFSVAYMLEKNALRIKYRVENTGRRSMYFGVGGHPAYIIDCDEKDGEDDVGGNVILFDGVQTPVRYVLDDAGEYITSVTPSAELSEIETSKKLFDRYKTLIYGGIKGTVRLLKRCGESIDFDLGGAPYLALWSHAKRGGYVCVEPWWGLPDFKDDGKEMAEKRSVRELESGKVFECGYVATYN